MGVYERIYGLAVFAVTCLFVKSHPKFIHHGQDGEQHHLYLRRSLASAAVGVSSDDTGAADSPIMMWGSLVLTTVITTVLVLALALCTCGKKKASSPEPELKPEENNDDMQVTQQPVGNGPSSPVVMTVDSPQTPQSPSPEMNACREAFQPISPSSAVMNSPVSPSFDISEIPYADAVSNSPTHGPSRATINRRLPQLPQSPPPSLPDGDDKEPDYDQTYDVIPEKRKDSAPMDVYDKGGGYERLRDTKANAPVMPNVKPTEGPYAKVNESRKKKNVVDESADPNYNSIEETRGATGMAQAPKADLLECDGHYASVGGDAVELKDDPYARVKDRSREAIDRSNGYARVRDVQNTPTSPPSELSGGAAATKVSPIPNHRVVEQVDEEEDVPPAIPEKLDLENVDLPISPTNQSQRQPSIGSASGISIHLQRTSPVPPASPNLSSNSQQAGLAASIAAGTAAVANEAPPDQQQQQQVTATQQPTNPTASQLKEKPYTEVSARECLDSVRARQQAEHTERTAAHYEFVNENDYDGIYETVNEGQMSPQPERPPPLPNNRQLQVAASPVASWQAPIARAALYEEINENDRLQSPPPAAVAIAEEDNDEMQPYAVTQNPTTTNRPSNLTAQRSAPNVMSGVMYAQVDKDRGGSVKTSELYSQVKRSPGGSVRSGANHDLRSKVEGPQSPPVATGATLSPNQPADFDGLYAKVQKTTSLDGSAQKRPNGVVTLQSPPEVVGHGPDSSYQSIDEVMNEEDVGNGVGAAGLVYVGQQPGSQRKWKRKEHTYQAVDSKSAKKGKKDKKKDNRTPSPQPQSNPWQPRFPQHSGYEEVNVNNAPILQGITNDNANKKSRSRANSREQGRVNGVQGNHDTRARTNSREQIGRVNGTTIQAQPILQTRSRTNSRDQQQQQGGVNGLPDDTGVITENGNNNCNQAEYFWPGYVQETRL